VAGGSIPPASTNLQFQTDSTGVTFSFWGMTPSGGSVAAARWPGQGRVGHSAGVEVDLPEAGDALWDCGALEILVEVARRVGRDLEERESGAFPATRSADRKRAPAEGAEAIPSDSSSMWTQVGGRKP
jgi:hypothetical protein